MRSFLLIFILPHNKDLLNEFVTENWVIIAMKATVRSIINNEIINDDSGKIMYMIDVVNQSKLMQVKAFFINKNSM